MVYANINRRRFAIPTIVVNPEKRPILEETVFFGRAAPPAARDKFSRKAGPPALHWLLLKRHSAARIIADGNRLRARPYSGLISVSGFLPREARIITNLSNYKALKGRLKSSYLALNGPYLLLSGRFYPPELPKKLCQICHCGKFTTVLARPIFAPRSGPAGVLFAGHPHIP